MKKKMKNHDDFIEDAFLSALSGILSNPENQVTRSTGDTFILSRYRDSYGNSVSYAKYAAEIALEIALEATNVFNKYRSGKETHDFLCRDKT